MNILIDPRSTQVQVQNETGSRLNTLMAALVNAGYSLSYVNYDAPLDSQLTSSVNLFIIFTHKWSCPPGWPPVIPENTDFRWPDTDLNVIRDWVSQGGSLLLISSHTDFTVNDIPLAAKFGIKIVPAFFCMNRDTLSQPLVMTPNTTEWPGLSENVSNVQAWDSCGISTQTGDVASILPFPPGTYDLSGQNYYVYNYAFAVAKTYGYGDVLVAGHSGIVGDYASPFPSPGQIDAGDTKQFLLNCVSYLGTAQHPA